MCALPFGTGAEGFGQVNFRFGSILFSLSRRCRSAAVGTRHVVHSKPVPSLLPLLSGQIPVQSLCNLAMVILSYSLTILQEFVTHLGQISNTLMSFTRTCKTVFAIRESDLLVPNRSGFDLTQESSDSLLVSQIPANYAILTHQCFHPRLFDPQV